MTLHMCFKTDGRGSVLREKKYFKKCGHRTDDIKHLSVCVFKCVGLNCRKIELEVGERESEDINYA